MSSLSRSRWESCTKRSPATAVHRQRKRIGALIVWGVTRALQRRAADAPWDRLADGTVGCVACAR